MATLIIGPEDLIKRSVMKDKSKLTLEDVEIIKCMNDYDDNGVDMADIKVVLYREGTEDVLLKSDKVAK